MVRGERQAQPWAHMAVEEMFVRLLPARLSWLRAWWETERKCSWTAVVTCFSPPEWKPQVSQKVPGSLTGASGKLLPGPSGAIYASAQLTQQIFDCLTAEARKCQPIYKTLPWQLSPVFANIHTSGQFRVANWFQGAFLCTVWKGRSIWRTYAGARRTAQTPAQDKSHIWAINLDPALQESNKIK